MIAYGMDRPLVDRQIAKLVERDHGRWYSSYKRIMRGLRRLGLAVDYEGKRGSVAAALAYHHEPNRPSWYSYSRTAQRLLLAFSQSEDARAKGPNILRQAGFAPDDRDAWRCLQHLAANALEHHGRSGGYSARNLPTDLGG